MNDLPLTREQSLVAKTIYEVYGQTHFERYPTEEDPSVTISAEFCEDEYYHIEVKINTDGTLEWGD